MLSRFAVIEIPAYTKEEFISITIEQLAHKVNDVAASFIANEVWRHSKSSNIRDCVRIANLCKTEDEIIQYAKTVK